MAETGEYIFSTLLLIAGGFLFLRFSTTTRFKEINYDGGFYYYASFAIGTIIFIIIVIGCNFDLFLIDIGYSPARKSFKPEPGFLLASFAKSNILTYSLATFLISFPISLVVNFLLNITSIHTPPKALVREVEKNGFEYKYYYSTVEDMPIMVELNTGKFYGGFIYKHGDNKRDPAIYMFPIISAYREPETGNLIENINYADLYNTYIEKNEKIYPDNYEIIINKNDVKSVRYLLKDAYEHFASSGKITNGSDQLAH